MTRSSILPMLVVGFLLAIAAGVGCGEPPPPPPVAPPAPDPAFANRVLEIRGKLNNFEFHETAPEMIGWGESAFPMYEVILADPDTKPAQVARAFIVIRQVKADRRRFLEIAVSRLADPARAVRGEAVRLLGEIGSEQDTPPVVALLSDHEELVCFAAAKALAAIGGKRDVAAMDVWLRSGNHRDWPKYLAHVKRCRDDLEVRLGTGVRPAPLPADGGKPIAD